MKKLLIVTFFIFALIKSINAFAQSQEISENWNLALSGYLLCASILVSALIYLINKAGKYLSERTNNEIFKGIISRFTHSVSDAVVFVDQTLRKEIEKKKDPNSPGGVKITESEKKDLKLAVWEALRREYGGLKGILLLFGKIGFNEKSATSKINTMIESSVNDLKMKKKIVDKSNP